MSALLCGEAPYARFAKHRIELAVRGVEKAGHTNRPLWRAAERTRASIGEELGFELDQERRHAPGEGDEIGRAIASVHEERPSLSGTSPLESGTMSSSGGSTRGPGGGVGNARAALRAVERARSITRNAVRLLIRIVGCRAKHALRQIRSLADLPVHRSCRSRSAPRRGLPFLQSRTARIATSGHRFGATGVDRHDGPRVAT